MVECLLAEQNIASSNLADRFMKRTISSELSIRELSIKFSIIKKLLRTSPEEQSSTQQIIGKYRHRRHAYRRQQQVRLGK